MEIEVGHCQDKVKSQGLKTTLKNYFLTYGIAFIPIIAAAHVDKSILKTTSRLPYFEYLFNDVSGVSTAQQIMDGKIVLHNNPLWINIMVSGLLTLFMIAGVWISIRVVKTINSKNSQALSNRALYLIPIIYGSLFLVMILVWRWM